jgi:hypothetical protein
MIAEQEPAGMSDAGAQAALETFVVYNDDLLELESHIGRFNIFDALGIARAEIRHSNFLAFILDPAESHGQGQLFLKAVLTDLLKQAPSERRPLSPVELDGTDLRGVEVKREWKHTDLLIRCREPPFVVVIENKIGAKEGPDQLSGYKKVVEVHYFYCASLAWSAAAAWANVSFGGPKEHAHVYSPGTAGGSRPSPADRCLC